MKPDWLAAALAKAGGSLKAKKAEEK